MSAGIDACPTDGGWQEIICVLGTAPLTAGTMPALHDTIFRRAAILAAACMGRYRNISYTWGMARKFLCFWDSSINGRHNACPTRYDF